MNRRSILVAGASAVAYGLAGCLGDGAGDGAGGGEPVSFEEWVPSPGIFGRDEFPTPFQYLAPQSLIDQGNGFVDTFLETHAIEASEPLFHLAGYELADLDLIVRSPDLYAAAQTEVDAEALVEQLESNDFTLEVEDAGRSIYQVEGVLGSPGAVGFTEDIVIRVGDGSLEDAGLLMAPMGADPVEAATEILDASEDSSQRYSADNPNIEALIDELGNGTVGFGERRNVEETSIQRGVFRDQRAWGADIAVGGSTSSFTEVFVFDADSEPPIAQMEQWIEIEHPHEWGPETPATGHSIEPEGNVVVVTGEFNTDDGFRLR